MSKKSYCKDSKLQNKKCEKWRSIKIVIWIIQAKAMDYGFDSIFAEGPTPTPSMLQEWNCQISLSLSTGHGTYIKMGGRQKVNTYFICLKTTLG